MDTISIVAVIIALVVLVLVISFIAAYVSVLLDDNEIWKMRAERFAELYFAELEENNNKNKTQ